MSIMWFHILNFMKSLFD